MSDSELFFREIEKGHIADVLEISNDELGADYLNYDSLDICLINENYHCITASYENKIVGFIRIVAFTSQEAKDYLKLPESPESRRFFSHNKIGFLESSAVVSGMKGKEVGRKLLSRAIYKLLEMNTEVICGMAWKDIHGVINAHKLLFENGLRPVFEVKEYWTMIDNSEDGQSCPVCGTPCRCSGVLYLRYLSKE